MHRVQHVKTRDYKQAQVTYNKSGYHRLCVVTKPTKLYWCDRYPMGTVCHNDLEGLLE